jgi:hypothetical protein
MRKSSRRVIYDNSELISEFNESTRGTYFVAFVVCIVSSQIFYHYYDSRDILTTNYLVGTIIFILFAILAIIPIGLLPKIIISNGVIEFKRPLNLLSQVIEKSQIEGWAKIYVARKSDSYEILYLLLNDRKVIKIKSSNYNNFNSLVNNLTYQKPKNIVFEKKLEKLSIIQFIYGTLLSGFILLSIATMIHSHSEDLTKNDVKLIKGRLSEQITLLKGSKRRMTLLIKLREFKQFDFKVYNKVLDRTYYNSLISDFNVGDEIEFSVLETEYEKKITKQTELRLWDYIGYDNDIGIVQINNNGL